MLLSRGSLAIFWSNPLVASLVALAILFLMLPLLLHGGALFSRRRTA